MNKSPVEFRVLEKIPLLVLLPLLTMSLSFLPFFLPVVAYVIADTRGTAPSEEILQIYVGISCLVAVLSFPLANILWKKMTRTELLFRLDEKGSLSDITLAGRIAGAYLLKAAVFEVAALCGASFFLVILLQSGCSTPPTLIWFCLVGYLPLFLGNLNALPTLGKIRRDLFFD